MPGHIFWEGGDVLGGCNMFFSCQGQLYLLRHSWFFPEHVTETVAMHSSLLWSGWNLTQSSCKQLFSWSGSSRSGTIIGNSVCMSSCLHVCLSACMLVYGSSSAHRQDGHHVYYTKRLAWTPWWCTFHFFFGCYQIWPPGGQKTVFLGSSSAHRQDQPHVYYTKRSAWTPRWFHVSFLFWVLPNLATRGPKNCFFGL